MKSKSSIDWNSDETLNDYEEPISIFLSIFLLKLVLSFWRMKFWYGSSNWSQIWNIMRCSKSATHKSQSRCLFYFSKSNQFYLFQVWHSKILWILNRGPDQKYGEIFEISESVNLDRLFDIHFSIMRKKRHTMFSFVKVILTHVPRAFMFKSEFAWRFFWKYFIINQKRLHRRRLEDSESR